MFNIDASGFQTYEGRHVTLLVREVLLDGYHLDTLIGKVAKGAFHFNGEMKNPAASARLDIEGERKNFTFIVDSGAMKIEFDPNIFPKELYPIYSKTNNLHREIRDIMSSILSSKDPAANQLDRNFYLRELDLIMRNPDNFYSAFVLAELSQKLNSVKTHELITAWELLSSDIKATETGKYLQRKVANRDKTAVGQTLPEFQFTDESGQVFTRENLLKKPYLIVLGASWCGPCKKLIPTIKATQKKYADWGLQVLYINFDNDEGKWKKMIQDYSMQAFANVYDTAKPNFSAMAFAFEIAAIPVVLAVDNYGIIQYNSIREYDYEIKRIDSYLDVMFY